MIKTIIASTSEVDDVNLAVEDIKSQLASENGNGQEQGFRQDTKLLKNTIGIATCHYEFVSSGVYRALCEKLPFEIIGTVSPAQAVPNESGLLLLTLMIITSDDTEFVKVLTPSLLSEPGKTITESYKSAARGKKPDLIFTFAAFMIENSGDDYVKTISEISDGAPCFGTLAVDDTADMSKCFILSDGDHYRDRMGMILAYGNIKPKFFIANISDNKILEKSAVVTKSSGHILMEVNGNPVMEYLEELGLTKASEITYAMSAIPFLLDYNDNTPKVSKIFISFTPEKYAICAGSMPQGSTLYIGITDKDDVLITTGEAVDKILESAGDASGLLIYSCISRGMALGYEQFKEMDLIREKLGGKIPFLMANSGGEICPTMVLNEKTINRFHNNAFIACLF